MTHDCYGNIFTATCFIPWLLGHENLWSHYDREADVLYLHFTKPNRADDSEMTDDDIIVRYEKGEVIGLTIMNVSKRLVVPVPS